MPHAVLFAACSTANCHGRPYSGFAQAVLSVGLCATHVEARKQPAEISNGGAPTTKRRVSTRNRAVRVQEEVVRQARSKVFCKCKCVAGKDRHTEPGGRHRTPSASAGRAS